jgi:hypothetical protein
MFNSYQVTHHIEHDRLYNVLESFEPPQRSIHVVCPFVRLLPARTKVFY